MGSITALLDEQHKIHVHRVWMGLHAGTAIKKFVDSNSANKIKFLLTLAKLHADFAFYNKYLLYYAICIFTVESLVKDHPEERLP